MSLMRTSYWATIIWTMFFIIFFAYFFVTASIVAFEDGFDDTVIERGYPSDFEKASWWSWKEYVIWTISWMPEAGMKEKFNKWCEKLDYPIEEEEIQDNDDGPSDEKQAKSNRMEILRIGDRSLYIPVIGLGSKQK